jgi:predicted enzyme related to lactoylglutathione lyase
MAGMTVRYEDGAPIWVDLGTTDVSGAAAFYGALFGWTHEDLGPEAGGYGMFRKDGLMVAGVGPATDQDRGTSWATYFQGDVDEAASRVAANGGVVIAAPMDVMDQGRLAVFTDPSGAFFSVWQPGKHTGAELVNKPGSLNWNELVTPDAGAARSFYAEVLGVGVRVVSMGEGMEYNLLEAGNRSVAGMMQMDPAWGQMQPHWEVYFTVEDCDASYASALKLGGVSAIEPQDSPAGRFAAINDPQGGRFSIIKNDPNFSM